MKISLLVTFAVILSLSIASTAFGQGSSGEAGSPFIKDFTGAVEAAEGKLLALEGAMKGKESWRPMEGVRSVSETYLHVAFGNYLMMKLVGFEPPADVNFSMDIKKWDTQTTDLSTIADILKASFSFLRASAQKVTPAQLDETMNFFGTEMTKRHAMLEAVGHIHEHLGQSIAYARMNNVVPPWTVAERAAEQETMDKAGK